jgi:hypothetical protein
MLLPFVTPLGPTIRQKIKNLFMKHFICKIPHPSHVRIDHAAKALENVQMSHPRGFVTRRIGHRKTVF